MGCLDRVTLLAYARASSLKAPRSSIQQRYLVRTWFKFLVQASACSRTFLSASSTLRLASSMAWLRL